MATHLSFEAQSIIDGAISAASAADQKDANHAADRAVEHIVGLLGLTNPQESSRMVDPLIEIVQLHVRQQLSEQ